MDAEHALNVIARGLGAARLMVLQPSMAFKQPLAPEERAFTAYAYREPVMKALYDQAAADLNGLAARDQVAFLDARTIYDGRRRRCSPTTSTSARTRATRFWRGRLQPRCPPTRSAPRTRDDARARPTSSATEQAMRHRGDLARLRAIKEYRRLHSPPTTSTKLPPSAS